jgi:hypothetical protein
MTGPLTRYTANVKNDLGGEIFIGGQFRHSPLTVHFGLNASLEDIAGELIDYCETRVLFPELISEIGKDNPKQHELHFAEIYRV